MIDKQQKNVLLEQKNVLLEQKNVLLEQKNVLLGQKIVFSIIKLSLHVLVVDNIIVRVSIFNRL